jgi:hypothetical protein
MKRAALLLLALWAAPTTSALADECDVMVAKLVSEQGVRFERRTASGYIHLKHPLVESAVIDCSRPVGGPSLSMSFDGAFPSAAFFDLLSQAGAVVMSKPVTIVRQSSQRCHRTALKDSDELAQIRAGGLQIECQSFTRDGGGTIISIFQERKP